MSATSSLFQSHAWGVAVNRKQFLKTIVNAATGASLFGGLVAGCFGAEHQHDPKPVSASLAETGRTPPAFSGRRGKSTFTGYVGFPPEAVFPLLCPVREYEWLDGWRCDMVYSDSGIAEDNCVFKTAHAGNMVWSVSRYEPPRRIEFTTFVPDHVVTRLNISLTPSGNGTNLQWTRIFTGLSEEGNKSVGNWNTEIDAELTKKLEHFLKTGMKLRTQGK